MRGALLVVGTALVVAIWATPLAAGLKFSGSDWTSFDLGTEQHNAPGQCVIDQATTRQIWETAVSLVEQRAPELATKLRGLVRETVQLASKPARTHKVHYLGRTSRIGPTVGSFHTLHAVVNQTLVSGSGDDGLYLTVEHDHSIELFENSHGKMFMFQHIFAPRLSAPHQPAPIRFMTYNLWNFEKRYSTRMDNVVRQIQAYQPHVIALQEVRYSNWEYPGSGRRYGFQGWDIVTSLPEYQFAFRPSMSYTTYSNAPDSKEVSGRRLIHTEEGLAILSKYPIEKVHWLTLSRNFSDGEDAHQRTIMATVIRTPLGLASAFSTHSSLSQSARIRNAAEIVSFMKDFPLPHIFMGDINEEPGSPFYQLLTNEQNPMLKDPIQGQDISSWTFTTLHKMPKKRIDMVLVSPNVHVQQAFVGDSKEFTELDTPPSDHRPVVVDLMFFSTQP